MVAAAAGGGLQELWMDTQAADGREDKQIELTKLHYGNSPTYYTDRIIER